MHKKGLSLFEVVVATILLSIIMTGLVGVILAGKRHILHSRSRMASGELGKLFLDPLQTDVRQSAWGSNCLSSSPTAGCPTTSQEIGSITYTPTYSISDVTGTNLRRVQLRISWTEPSS